AVPPTELVVSVPVVLTKPAPPSLSAPEPVRVTAPPPPAVTDPVSASAPVLFTVTLPPPLSLILVSVSGAAVFVRLTFPLVVFVALKLPTVLAPFSAVPPTELVDNSAPLIVPAPDSLTAPELVKLTWPPPAALIGCATVMLPAEFVSDIAPLVVVDSPLTADAVAGLVREVMLTFPLELSLMKIPPVAVIAARSDTPEVAIGVPEEPMPVEACNKSGEVPPIVSVPVPEILPLGA